MIDFTDADRRSELLRAIDHAHDEIGRLLAKSARKGLSDRETTQLHDAERWLAVCQKRLGERSQ